MGNSSSSKEKPKGGGTATSTASGEGPSQDVARSSTQGSEGQRVESVVEEERAGDQGKTEGGGGEKEGEEGFGSTIGPPPPAQAEAVAEASMPQKSSTGYSSITTVGSDDAVLRSDTSGSESGFLSEGEFSTESELSSDDSLFEFEIDQPVSGTGTLKMKPKAGIDVNTLKREKRKHRSERRKNRTRHHHEGKRREATGDGGREEDEGEEEVDWPWSKEKKEKRHKFHKLQRDLDTGDLCIMYRAKSKEPQFGIFVNYKECNPQFPLLLLKGRSKFMSLAEFDRHQAGPKYREVRLISASSRIFYGDYNKVYVCRLNRHHADAASCMRIDEVIQAIEKTPFSPGEVEAIEAEIKSMTPVGFHAVSGEDSIRPYSRVLTIPSALVVAYVYKELGYLRGDPWTARPSTLEEMLDLGPRMRVKVPKPRWGPVQKGEPPLLAKLVDITDVPHPTKPVPLGSLLGDLETGDIVLMAGMGAAGSMIRLFDRSEFSHVALVVKAPYINQLMIFESSTNKSGLVDIETGRVSQGVELFPLEVKVFSGWYGRVAIRRLVGLSSEKREGLGKKLMEFYSEVSGRPYERNKMHLILASLTFIEEALPFLKNRKEDLSSLFCSELVAATYQHMGLLNRDKPSHSFTPDDFSTNRGPLQLTEGSLSEQIYVDLKEADAFQLHYEKAMRTPDPL